MKSVVYSRTGDPSVLQLVDRDLTEPGPGEVRVRIVVSGVNPTDWKSRLGSGDGAAPPFPEVTPNQDGAGVVDALGEGVENLAVGDRVWVYLAGHQRPTGTAQEYTNLPADRVVRLPDRHELRRRRQPRRTGHDRAPRPDRVRGRTRAAASPVPSPARSCWSPAERVRWVMPPSSSRAGLAPPSITTVSSPAKAALATAAGAHHVINYRDEDAATAIAKLAPDGVDLVVEVAISANAAAQHRGGQAPRVRRRSTPTTVAASSRFAVRPNMIKNVRYQFVLLYTVGDAALTAAMEDITLALVDEALPVGEDAGLPLHRFPLADTADAHQAVQDGAVGKVLIDVP